jgi:cell division transport system ATP-binding protein
MGLARVQNGHLPPDEACDGVPGRNRERTRVETPRSAARIAENGNPARHGDRDDTAPTGSFGHHAMLHSPGGDCGGVASDRARGPRTPHDPGHGFPCTSRGPEANARGRLPPLPIRMILLEKITKSYNGRLALRGISTKVERGEFIYLTGPSGAGKSTFLRLLYRAELPDSGRIVVNGSDLPGLRRRDVAEFRRRLGVIFQDFKLLRRRTVAENVTFVLSLLNLPERDQQRRAYLVLKQMGLQHRMSAYPDELSGGEQQRVAIARALVLQPDLILADEPTGNLDPERSHELLELFKTINYQGTTVVVATHDRGLIDAHPARTLFLDRGNLVKDAWGPFQ